MYSKKTQEDIMSFSFLYFCCFYLWGIQLWQIREEKNKETKFLYKKKNEKGKSMTVDARWERKSLNWYIAFNANKVYETLFGAFTLIEFFLILSHLLLFRLVVALVMYIYIHIKHT